MENVYITNSDKMKNEKSGTVLNVSLKYYLRLTWFLDSPLPITTVFGLF